MSVGEGLAPPVRIISSLYRKCTATSLFFARSPYFLYKLFYHTAGRGKPLPYGVEGSFAENRYSAFPKKVESEVFHFTSMCRQTPVHVISSEGEAGVERSKTLENLTLQISPLASLGRDDTKRVLCLQSEAPSLREPPPIICAL